MEYDPSDIERVTTLKDVEPLLAGKKSLLHVGEQMRQGWEFWPDWFKSKGIEVFDVLEVYPPNVERLRAMPLWRRVYESDVRAETGFGVDPVDIVFWWHGPEHVTKADFFGSIYNLEDGWQPSLIILGMPWGRHGNWDMKFDNPASYHVSTWYPEDPELAGWTCRTHGPKDVPSGHITAWRETCSLKSP